MIGHRAKKGISKVVQVGKQAWAGPSHSQEWNGLKNDYFLEDASVMGASKDSPSFLHGCVSSFMHVYSRELAHIAIRRIVIAHLAQHRRVFVGHVAGDVDSR